MPIALAAPLDGHAGGTVYAPAAERLASLVEHVERCGGDAEMLRGWSCTLVPSPGGGESVFRGPAAVRGKRPHEHGSHDAVAGALGLGPGPSPTAAERECSAEV